MDPIIPKPNLSPTPTNLPTNTPAPTDLSYQVMPQEGNFNTAPTPPPSYHEDSSGSSFFKSKTFLIIMGLVVLILVGIAVYLFVINKKDSTSQIETAPKLPKVWMTTYFGAELCTDDAKCGESADPDTDGLNNFDEFKAGTSPVLSDSDVDGLADGDEVNIFKTDPSLKYTDRREIVSQNNWTDSFQVKNDFDPLSPGLKFTDTRKQQITEDISKFGLHSKSSETPLPSPTTPTPSTTPTVPNSTPTPAPTSKTYNVAIQSSAFAPKTLTIKKGDTVIWTNKDSMSHTVTSDSSGPSSPSLKTNETYSYSFAAAGTYLYHCSLHPSMTATVIVQ